MNKTRILISILWSMGVAPVPTLTLAQGPTETPTQIVESYLDALQESDLDRAEALFAASSSIFESGSDEGTWQHYREHHIGPELHQFASFGIKKGDPREELSTDGSLAFVVWPIDYTIELESGEVVESRGVVTSVLVREGETYLIRHLHWSSRRRPAP